MANELTRKGIAFGAAVALGSTLIVGGAANAAPNANYQDLELSAAQGSEDSGVLATTSDDYFGLILSWNGDVNTANFDDLNYNVTFADADAEDGEGRGAFGTTYGYYDDYEDQIEAAFDDVDCFTGDYVGYNAPHAGGNLTDTEDDGGVGYTGPVGAWDITESFDEDESDIFDEWGTPFIRLQTCDYTPDEKTVATVQAFIDTNNNNVIDGSETHSAPVEVTFWNPAALTPVLTLEDDGVVYDADAEDGTGPIDYEITIAEPLNEYWTEDADDTNSEFYGDFFVESYVDGVDYDEDSVYFQFTDEDSILYDSDSIEYDVTDGVEDLNSSITRVRAGVYNEATEETVYTAWQNIVAKEASVDYADGFVTEQDYVYVTGEDAVIRDDVETVEYNIEFTDDQGEDNVTVAGVDATVYAYFYGDEDELADYGVTVGGVEGVETAEDSDVWEFVVEGTSNADGVMSFDIEVENPDSDFYIGVEFVEFEGTNSEVYGDLYWDETLWYIDFQGSFSDGSNATAPVGGSFDFEIYVTDQWGFGLDDAELRVYSEDRDGWDQKDFAINNGLASVKVTDGAPEDGEELDQAYDVDLVVDGVVWNAEDVADGSDEDFDIDWLTESAEAGYVTADWNADYGQSGDGLTNVSYYDFVAGNYELEWRKLDADEMFWPAYEDGDGEWLEILVHGPDGYLQGGQKFTVSGAGLYFFEYDEEAARAGIGSVSGITDGGGSAWVWVQGHNVGEHTITVTANGKSTTVDLTVLDENLYGSAVSVAPFTGKAGTAETISATVTDKFGNKVPDAEVSFSAVGGGYFNDATGTTGGDADDSVEDVATAGYGVATSQLIIQSGEVGYGTTVTATIDVVDPLGVAEDTTASASLAAGATDFGKPAFWTKDLGDGTLKLYAKNIVGAGKIQFFHNGKEIAWIKAVDALDPKLRAANGSYYLVRTVKLVSGKNVLEIKDDGTRVVRRVASK